MGDTVDDEELIKNAVFVLAHYLGIDLDKESHLVWIAEEALDNLPPGWEFGVSDEGEHAGLPYFYNSETEESVWTHPLEDVYREKVRKLRRKDLEKEANRPNSSGGGSNNGNSSRPGSSGGGNDRGRERETNRGKDSRDASRDARDRRGNSIPEDVDGDDDDQRGRSPQRRDQDRNRDVAFEEDSPPRRAQRGWDSNEPAQNNNKASNQNNNRRNNDITEVTEIEEIEDFDDNIDDSPKKPSNQSSSSHTHQNESSVAGKKPLTNNATSAGFGMSEDDFFDDDGDNAPHDTASAVSAPRTTVATVSSNNANKDNHTAGHARETTKDPQLSSNTSQSNVHNNNSNNNSSNNNNNSLGFQSKFLTNNNNKAQEKPVQQSQSQASNPNYANNNNNNAAAAGDRWFRLPEDKQSGGTGRDGSVREGRDRERERDNSRDARDRDRDRGRDQGRERDRSADSANSNNRRGRDSIERDRVDRDRDRERDRSRDAREREARERELRDRELRERELRERELRDDRERDRERDRDRSLQATVDDLRHERDMLRDELRDLRHRHHQEITTQREELRNAELKMQEERRMRFQQEENSQREITELQRRIREFDEQQELTVREALRKQRVVFDEELAEKIRTKERSALDTQDALRQEVMTFKRKVDELQREQEQLRRKLALSKDDIRSEFQTDIDQYQVKIREQEEEIRRFQQEQRHLRDELSAFAQKNGLLSQTIQAQTIELENARQVQASNQQENTFQAAAVTHATQRALQLEQEIAQLRAQYMVLSQERDKMERNYQQVTTQQVVNGESSIQLEQELRKIKRQHQQETQRLTSRIVELEALQSMTQEQQQRNESYDTQQVRTLKFEVMRMEEEKQVFSDRITSLVLKEEELLTRSRQLEKENLLQQESLYRKDKQIQEESARFESLRNSIQTIRTDYDQQMQLAKEKIQHLEEQIEAREQTHAEAKRQWEKEITMKVPKLVASAIEQAQITWEEDHNHIIASSKKQYEQLLQRKEQELADIESEYRSQAMKERVRKAEESMEVDKLRTYQRQLQIQLEEKDNLVLDMKRQIRLLEHTMQEQRMLAMSNSSGMLPMSAGQNMSMILAPPTPAGYAGLYGSGSGPVMSAASRRYAYDDTAAVAQGMDDGYAYSANNNTSMNQVNRSSDLQELMSRSADFSGLVEQSLGLPKPSAYQPPLAPGSAASRQQQNQSQFRAQMPQPQPPQASVEDAAVALLSQELAVMRQQLAQVLSTPHSHSVSSSSSSSSTAVVSTPKPLLTHMRVQGESERKYGSASTEYTPQNHLQQHHASKSVHFQDIDASSHTEPGINTNRPIPSTTTTTSTVVVSQRAQSALLSGEGSVDDPEVSELIDHIAANLPSYSNNPLSSSSADLPEELMENHDNSSLSINQSRVSQQSQTRPGQNQQSQQSRFQSQAQQQLDAYFPASYTPVGRGAPASTYLPRTSSTTAPKTNNNTRSKSSSSNNHDTSLMSMSMMSVESMSSSVDTQQRSTLFPQQRMLDFSAISDGGYHPGYWRSKYAKK